MNLLHVVTEGWRVQLLVMPQQYMDNLFPIILSQGTPLQTVRKVILLSDRVSMNLRLAPDLSAISLPPALGTMRLIARKMLSMMAFHYNCLPALGRHQDSYPSVSVCVCALTQALYTPLSILHKAHCYCYIACFSVLCLLASGRPADCKSVHYYYMRFSCSLDAIWPVREQMTNSQPPKGS